MEEIRAPVDKEKVREDYLKGMKYKELAEKYGVTLNTIKSWKQRYNWDRKGVHTKEKVCTQNKNVKKELKLEEVLEVDNPELTEKQRLFCIYYIKYFNATKAAVKAGYSKDTAYSQGPRLLENVEVQNEIKRLKAAKFKGAFLEKEDLLQKYIDIAFSDITDYLDFGQEEVQVMGAFGPLKIKYEDGEEKELKKVVNVVKFKESIEVDGTIVSEVKQGKDGASIKLQDKMKALDFLSKHIGLLDIEAQEKIKIAREKLEIDKAKINNGNGDTNREGIQEFINATTMTEEQVKELFKDDDIDD